MKTAAHRLHCPAGQAGLERLGESIEDCHDGREDLLVAAPPPFPTPYFDTSASAVFVYEGNDRLVNRRPALRLDGGPGFGSDITAGAP